MLAVFLLTLYLVLAFWVVLAFGRLMAGLAMDAILSLQGFFGRTNNAVPQTLDNTLIIDSPSLKKPLMRLMETVFSAAVWVFFVYLFQTIVTTVMWILGLERIYHMNISIPEVEGTLEATVFALCAAGIFIGALFAWAQWNYWIYGRLEQRRSRATVSTAEVAEHFSVPLVTINRLQASKISSIMPMPVGLIFREIQVANSALNSNVASHAFPASAGG